MNVLIQNDECCITNDGSFTGDRSRSDAPVAEETTSDRKIREEKESEYHAAAC